MRYQPVFHTIVSMDVVGSGERDDQLIHLMRRDLREMVTDVLAEQAIDITALHVRDLGDGIQLLAPAEITPKLLLDPFVSRLDAALRGHRKAASAAHRIRLRVAVHFGLVNWDGTSWEGSPLKHVARLLDAEVVRQAINEVPEANLVLVVSQDVFDGLVRHGVALDPAAFREVRVMNKDLTTAAWLYLPGYPPASPSAPAHQPGPAGRGAEPGGAAGTTQSSGVSIVADQVTIHGPLAGRDVNA